MTTHQDPQGRPTVFDKLPPEMPRVISIGRLDFNTGRLVAPHQRRRVGPSSRITTGYRLAAPLPPCAPRGRVTQADLDALKDGIEIEASLWPDRCVDRHRTGGQRVADRRKSAKAKIAKCAR